MYKIISWNVNGIRAAYSKGLSAFIKSHKADIYAFQETKAHEEVLSEDLKKLPGYTSHWFSAVKKGYSGVCFYTRKDPLKVISGIGEAVYDCEGRVITAEYDDFYLINCYFPNSQEELKRLPYKLSFNNAVLKFTKNLKKNKAKIMCGDFNVAHKAIDLKNPKSNEFNPGYSIQERNWMDKYINAGFVDTFRIFEKGPDHYTWWSYRFKARDRNIGWRIDYFCIDKKHESRVKSSTILSDVLGSDHCPITLKLI